MPNNFVIPKLALNYPNGILLTDLLEAIDLSLCYIMSLQHAMAGF